MSDTTDGPSLFAHLRERKLIQWAVAYVAGAWLLLEVTSFAGESFGWPESLNRILFIVFALGLIVTLVLAWYHGEKGRQRASGPELLIIAGVLAIGGFLAMIVGPGANPPGGPATTEAASEFDVEQRDPRAIAVLPLDNLSPDPNDAFFAGGLHNEVLTQLSRVAALTVISRTSVMGYVGPDMPPLREIASELGVARVLEGSVQVVGGRLRVSVQLIDAATDAQLWADSYDRTLDDAFAVQSEIASQVVVAVNARLSRDEQRHLATAPTEDAEAYRLYLQGREYETRPGRLQQNLEVAQDLYERALGLDPGFALARAALSQVHGKIYWYRYDPSLARARRQRDEAEEALRLEPDLPQAHVAMGLAHYWGHRDYAKALDEFGLASVGLPNDSWLSTLLGAVNRRLGHWDEAIAAFERATQLNPRDVAALQDLAGTLVTLRRYPNAARAYERALSLAPDNHGIAVDRARLYVHWQGQLDSLRAALGRLPRDAELGNRGTMTGQYARLLHWERRADSLLQVLAQVPTSVIEEQDFFLPVSLFVAWAHQLREDSAAARAAFNAARVLLDSVIIELPDDRRVHFARGLALAGRGFREEALQEARWLEESVAYREDRYGGTRSMHHRAQILAQMGEAEGALDEIERLLGGPSRALSIHTLRLDPLWDPIREHPRFRELLATYGDRPDANQQNE